MSPFFSTIIPTYNRAHLLGETLDSVLAQEFDDNEIIVIDDGSTDATDELLARYEGRIRVFWQSQQGPGAARNLGIKHARGRYIAFLDSDDLWFPWTLATYERVIRDYDFPAFLTGKELRFWNPSELRRIHAAPLRCARFPDFFATSDTFFEIIPGAVAASTAALRNVGGFTSRWINAEDSDLWMRLGTAAGFVRIFDPPLFAYREHDVSALADFQRTYEGCRYLASQERKGNYPGGAARRRERLAMLTRYIRPASFKCLWRGDVKGGWQIYRECFWWHARMMRVRYLFGFPLLAALRALTRHSARNKLRFDTSSHKPRRNTRITSDL